MRTDICVQDIAALRIDPAILARPDRRLALIASPANAARLQARGRVDVYTDVIVLDEFDLDTLTGAVEVVRAGLPVADRDDLALLCHDEYSLELVARVREKLDIAGDRLDQLRTFVDKIDMKKALAQTGVRLPRHVRWDPSAYRASPHEYAADVVAEVGLPAFAKPTNESGSVGTRRLDGLRDLHDWAAGCLDGSWEVDEFVAGTLYHIDTAWQDGSAVHVAINQDVHPCYDYVEGRISGSFTLPAEDPAYAALLDFNARVLDALVDKPARSVFHHEVFRKDDGELVFLEIAARAPAALIPFTSQIRYGLNIEEAHFRLQRGETLQAPVGGGPYAAYVYFPKQPGTVARLRPAVLRSDHRWTWNVAVGDELTTATNIRDFAASVLLWNFDFDALQHDLQVLDEHAALDLA